MMRGTEPDGLGGLQDPDPPAPVSTIVYIPQPWAAELPVSLEAWPDFCARWELGRVRLTWPEGSPGLVAEVPGLEV